MKIERTEDLETPIKDQGIIKSPVRFGDDVWVATKCVITRGTDIGAHSVVGAGAVVRGAHPPFVVLGGVPARVLKQREPVGRRLDFLLQEFNREANTLGSKSVDSRTSNAAVELKVLIDQIREQVQNIE